MSSGALALAYVLGALYAIGVLALIIAASQAGKRGGV